MAGSRKPRRAPHGPASVSAAGGAIPCSGHPAPRFGKNHSSGGFWFCRGKANPPPWKEEDCVSKSQLLCTTVLRPLSAGWHCVIVKGRQWLSDSSLIPQGAWSTDNTHMLNWKEFKNQCLSTTCEDLHSLLLKNPGHVPRN